MPQACKSARWFHGALLAISGGLLLALPIAATGLLDWWSWSAPPRPAAPPGHNPPPRDVSATLLFAGTWLAQRPGYLHGTIHGVALALSLIGEATLVLGGWLGGSIVFIHRRRVLAGLRRPAHNTFCERPHGHPASERPVIAPETRRSPDLNSPLSAVAPTALQSDEVNVPP